jgi:hypothetical protein
MHNVICLFYASGEYLMARTTISIPDDLKKRMDRVKEPVNWSAIAKEAFELKLGDLARNRKEKTMDNVVERLRASKIQRVNTITKEGQQAGAEWAKDTAEFDELERIDEVNTNEWFNGIPNAPYGWCDYLAFMILGTREDELSGEVSRDFWEAAVGDASDSRLKSEEFLTGFIDGASEVYRSVASKL